MKQLAETEWQAKLDQAKRLEDAGKACGTCGGTGGWPGITEHIPCLPCQGSGTTDLK